MHKLLAVVRREFNARVRTRSFAVATVIGPVLMAALMIVPALLSMRQSSSRYLVVLDGGDRNLGRTAQTTLGETFPDNYSIEVVEVAGDLTATRDSLIALIDAPESGAVSLDGLVVLDPEQLANDSIAYYGSNVSSMSDMRGLSRGLRQALVTARLTELGVNLTLVREAQRPFQLSTERVTDGMLTGESGEASFALAYAMAILLYMALLLYGVQVMGAVVEEKSNRINEVLVSSLRPFDLLMGKVLGVGAAGLMQLGIWVGTAMVLTTFRTQIAEAFGVPAQTVMSLPIPTVSPALAAVFLAFFLLGFFLYAAAYAAVGAMCSTMQETQQASMPVTLTVIVAFFMVFNVLNDPNGSMAHTMSLVPFFAPLVVPVRYSLNPLSAVELLTSAGITLLGVIIVVWIAARIYRVGILMHGKRPQLKQLFTWIKTG
jgi:ABC-2 type transport system permease protein